jgi:hypothetical protein
MLYVEIPERANHSQSVASQRFKMSATSDKDDLVPAAGQARTKISAHRASAHHGDTHDFPPIPRNLFSGFGDVNFATLCKIELRRFKLCAPICYETKAWRKSIRSGIMST